MDKGERLAAVSAQPCSLDAVLIDSLAAWRDVEAAFAGCS